MSTLAQITQHGISEDSSEKAQPRRGRPRTWDYEYLDDLARIFPEIRTRRGLQELSIWIQAYKLIHDAYNADPGNNRWAEYYVDPKAGQVFHHSIMAKLGRDLRDSLLIETAKTIAERRLKTRDAIAYIERITCQAVARAFTEMKRRELVDAAAGAE